MANSRPSLRDFERQIAERNHQDALRTAIRLLDAVDDRFGRLDNVEVGRITTEGSDEEVVLVFCTRFAASFGALLTDPGLAFTPVDYERLLTHHRWIDLAFSLSGFRSSDHLLPLLANRADPELNQMTFEGVNLQRLLAILSLNSAIGIDLNQFWRANPVAAAVAFLHYISSRYVFLPRAFNFRERLLEWLPDRLSEVNLGSLTLARLPEIYMHCSYAITSKKHAIKAELMRQMRRACLNAGCQEFSPDGPTLTAERPTVVVVAEHFVPGHAVHRTHSLSVASLRERFHVMGVIFPPPFGTPIEDLFDECLETRMKTEYMQMLTNLAAEILKRKPKLVLYLGVGMVPQVIGLASLRLAPVQCVSFGHTATTMSPTMDYFVLPADFVGAQSAFSEKVLALPKAAMPFQPRPFEKRAKPAPDGIVRVAVPASIMKLNPVLFDAIAKIAAGVRSRTEIQFFPLAATGLPYFELARVVRARIRGATVFPEAPHEIYMERLNCCDLFLCHFPYGNMNSIVDAFRLGLPGICLDGPEAHAHADTAFFARIGLPPELTAQTIDDYIAAAIRLIDDAQWRAHCRKHVEDADLHAAFFAGDASLFCKAIAELIAS
jgi:hypothetical protein